MTCGVIEVMNWGGGLQMFLKPLSKYSGCFSNILLITFQPVTFKSVNYATLFCYLVFIFRCHQFIFQGLFTLKCTCMPYLLQMFLMLSLRPLVYGTVMKLLLKVFVLVSLFLFLTVLGVLFFSTSSC